MAAPAFSFDSPLAGPDTSASPLAGPDTFDSFGTDTFDSFGTDTFDSFGADTFDSFETVCAGFSSSAFFSGLSRGSTVASTDLAGAGVARVVSVSILATIFFSSFSGWLGTGGVADFALALFVLAMEAARADLGAAVDLGDSAPVGFVRSRAFCL